VIGEGRATFHEKKYCRRRPMKRAGITTVALEAKEGLSLLNGTQGMLALLSLALREAGHPRGHRGRAASLSLDAFARDPGAFDARIMHARAYAEQRQRRGTWRA